MLFANTLAKVWNGVRDYSSKYFQRLTDSRAFNEKKESLREVRGLPKEWERKGTLKRGRKLIQECDTSAYSEKIYSEIERSRREVERASSFWNVLFSPTKREEMIAEHTARSNQLFQVLDNINIITNSLYKKYQEESQGKKLVDREFYVTHRAVRDLDDIVYRNGDFSQYVAEEAREFVPYPEAKVEQIVGDVYRRLLKPSSKFEKALRRILPKKTDDILLRNFSKSIYGEQGIYLKKVIRESLLRYDELSLYNPRIANTIETQVITEVTNEANKQLELAKREPEEVKFVLAGHHIGL